MFQKERRPKIRKKAQSAKIKDMRQHVKKLLGKIHQAAKEKRIAKFRRRFAEAYPNGAAFMGNLPINVSHATDKGLFILADHLPTDGFVTARGPLEIGRLKCPF